MELCGQSLPLRRDRVHSGRCGGARTHPTQTRGAWHVEPRRGVLGRGRRTGCGLGEADRRLRSPTAIRDGASAAGGGSRAEKLLHEICEADLRCLDAHAHLGNLDFEPWPLHAIRHYEMGVRIGELSLGVDFRGVLLWRMIDNRPFLRCLHGYGLCLWRMGRFDEAYHVFERMLWLNY